MVKQVWNVAMRLVQNHFFGGGGAETQQVTTWTDTALISFFQRAQRFPNLKGLLGKRQRIS